MAESKRSRQSVIQAGSTRWQQRRPNYSLLAEYEDAALNNPAISSGLQVIIETMISMAGEISHPDPEIQDFCRYSLNHMQVDWRRRFAEAVFTAFWSGCSVSEILFRLDRNGRLVHDDLICYHPRTIHLRVNRQGRLVEGEPTDTPGVTSGIWQVSDSGEVLLPLWKTVYLVHEPRHGNVYGQPLVAKAYKYHLLKETYEEMMTTALDRFGHPLLWVKVGAGLSDETVVDPATGEERQLTVQELVARDMQNLSGGNVLVFSQLGDVEPEVHALTTGNNIGDTFLAAIRYCDLQVYRSLLIPFIVLSDASANLSTAGAAERQMEIFSLLMRSLFKRFVNPFAAQLFRGLLIREFNRESAEIPPYFPIRQVTRPEERVSMMQMIVGLTESGYLNPQNDHDWAMVRQFVDADEREKTDLDDEYIYNMVVFPRTQGKRRNKRGRPAGLSRPQMRPR